MPAPKGNQFWKLRSRHGRDKLFNSPKLLWKAACEYFEWMDKNPWQKKEQLKKAQVIKNNKTGKEKLHALIDIPTSRPYTLSGLCLYLNASESYWRNFRLNTAAKISSGATKEAKAAEDFLTVISRVEEIISTQQFEGATVGAFNANIIARKQGLIEKVQNENRNYNINSVDLTSAEIKQINKELENDF
jgi:hypothetical protein